MILADQLLAAEEKTGKESIGPFLQSRRFYPANKVISIVV